MLKYVHSPFLKESVNIGLLIFFENTGEFFFEYSKNLSRIKYIYDNVPEKTIVEYLRQIENKISKISLDTFELLEINDFQTYISRTILPADGSCLQFYNFESLSQYEFDNRLIKNVLKDKYLIEDIKTKSPLSKDPELIKSFYLKLNSGLGFDILSSNKKGVFKDYEIRNDNGVSFKFDFAWQNGSLNLVKPISFDLKDSKYIANKAHKNLGQFIDLEEKAKDNNLRYDLLVGRPKTKKLYKDYDHALYLLEKIEYSRIIEEDKISDYSNKAVKAILSSS